MSFLSYVMFLILAETFLASSNFMVPMTLELDPCIGWNHKVEYNRPTDKKDWISFHSFLTLDIVPVLSSFNNRKNFTKNEIVECYDTFNFDDYLNNITNNALMTIQCAKGSFVFEVAYVTYNWLTETLFYGNAYTSCNGYSCDIGQRNFYFNPNVQYSPSLIEYTGTIYNDVWCITSINGLYLSLSNDCLFKKDNLPSKLTVCDSTHVLKCFQVNSETKTLYKDYLYDDLCSKLYLKSVSDSKLNSMSFNQLFITNYLKCRYTVGINRNLFVVFPVNYGCAPNDITTCPALKEPVFTCDENSAFKYNFISNKLICDNSNKIITNITAGCSNNLFYNNMFNLKQYLYDLTKKTSNQSAIYIGIGAGCGLVGVVIVIGIVYAIYKRE